MRALITGGAGFLGSLAADHLLAQGHEVLAVDNFATGRRDNLIERERLRIVEGSIAERELVDTLFDEFRPTHVLHAAAAYKNPDDWTEDVQSNVLGTVNIASAARRLEVKRLIYFQTALCYGKARERPVTLNHPLAPFSSYAISKTAGEYYVKLSGLPYVSLRLANIYGPRHLSGPMPTFYKRLRAGQKCIIVDTRRDFLEAEDFLNLLDAVLREGAATGCFNVSSGTDYSIREVFDLMVERMNIKLDEPVEVLPPNADDVSSLLLDPTETEKSFNWKAGVSLQTGIERLVRWYDENGVEETYTHLQIGKKA